MKCPQCAVEIEEDAIDSHRCREPSQPEVEPREEKQGGRSAMRTNLLLALGSLVFFSLVVEGGARAQHWWRYPDSSAFSYGVGYIRELPATVSGWWLGTTGYGFGNPGSTWPQQRLRRPGIDEVVNDALADPLRETAPTTEIIWGHPVELNKYGHRGSEVTEAKLPNTLRITMHGGSFVFGVGVADEYAFDRLLEEKLNAPHTGPAPAYEVVNLGQGGADITTVLRIFAREGIRLEPDISIIISAYNNYKLFLSTDERSFIWHVSKGLYSTSLFYATLREKLALLRFKDNNILLYDYDVRITSEKVQAALQYYRAALEKIIDLSAQNGIQVVFGLQPISLPAGLEELQELANDQRMAALEDQVARGRALTYYEAMYYMQSLQIEAMIEVAAKHGVPVVDCGRLLPEDKYNYFIDQVHPNESGTPFVAQAIYDFFESSALQAETSDEPSQ